MTPGFSEKFHSGDENFKESSQVEAEQEAERLGKNIDTIRYDAALEINNDICGFRGSALENNLRKMVNGNFDLNGQPIGNYKNIDLPAALLDRLETDTVEHF